MALQMPRNCAPKQFWPPVRKKVCNKKSCTNGIHTQHLFTKQGGGFERHIRRVYCWVAERWNRTAHTMETAKLQLNGLIFFVFQMPRKWSEMKWNQIIKMTCKEVRLIEMNSPIARRSFWRIRDLSWNPSESRSKQKNIDKSISQVCKPCGEAF